MFGKPRIRLNTLKTGPKFLRLILKHIIDSTCIFLPLSTFASAYMISVCDREPCRQHKRQNRNFKYTTKQNRIVQFVARAKAQRQMYVECR